jgi:thiol-disulfide isomerase/thioredoxin
MLFLNVTIKNKHYIIDILGDAKRQSRAKDLELDFMKKSVLTVTLLSVAVTLLAASCANKSKPAVSAPDAEATEVAVDGELAYDFELPNLQGSTTKLSSLRGKYVVIDFWGSWCVWCIRGIPKMKEAYTKYKDKMEILGVDCRDTEEAWKSAVDEHQLPWMQVRCPDDQLQTIAAQYNIEGFPTKVIINPDGKLVKTVVGEDPAFYTFLDELFK